jgi:hypothetical protein
MFEKCIIGQRKPLLWNEIDGIRIAIIFTTRKILLDSRFAD